jgi:DNA polymerase III epsilon subunit-like protein
MAKAINSWIFLDFETGGFDPKTCGVCEVAMVGIKGDTLEKIDIVSTYIKPYGLIYDDKALQSNGITFEDMESGVTLQEAVNEMIELLRKADYSPRNKGSKPILVAHNSPFDKGFLIQMFSITKKLDELEKLTFGIKDYYGNYQPEMLDSQFLVKAAYGNDPDIPNFKLATVMEKAGIDLSDAHKAINDTIGLKDMSVKLFDKLRSEGGSSESREAVSGTKFRNHFCF